LTGLAFLTPDAVSESVSARTPMERLARAAGARSERRDGWSVAVAYGEPAIERERLAQSVAFADRSSLTKLELQAEPGVLAAVVAAAGGGVTLKPGSAARVATVWWCPVTPSRVLALGEPAGADALRAAVAGAVNEVADGENVTVADVTCGLAALALLGPGARELLARFCAIDVRPAVTPVAGFRPGSVARTPGYVLRDGEDRLLVMVGWALGEYLWQVVADAAENLGGGPVGADALEELARA
jgi:heterotetrameric sarcosine oxidase gamma subunit